MEIAAPNSYPVPGDTGQPAPAASGLSANFDAFLKMLTAQLENQDPLNPMDSTDFAAQLAAFSTVEQQVQTNQHLVALQAQAVKSEMANLAGWIGKRVEGHIAHRFDGAPLHLDVPEIAGADKAQLLIRDAQGRIAARRDIAPRTGNFTWDGKGGDGSVLPAGLYDFSVLGFRDGKELQEYPVLNSGVVQQVQRDGQSIQLVLEGGTLLPVNGIRSVAIEESSSKS